MVFATNPVWMIKTRMQLQDNTAKPGTVRPYAGLVGETPQPTLLVHCVLHRCGWQCLLRARERSAFGADASRDRDTVC